ncbi:MAG TPA: hypothetical protein VJA19_01160 [Pseudomonas sp.]|nr:hypothetical protein [Pseudomonas sp.]
MNRLTLPKSLFALLLSGGLTLASGALYAHEDAPQAPRHNGVVVEAASGMTAELSLDGGMLMIYLHDHAGGAISSASASGEVILLSGSVKQVLPLSPSGGNSLMAQGSYQAAAGSKAFAKITLPGKPAEQFRFVLN